MLAREVLPACFMSLSLLGYLQNGDCGSQYSDTANSSMIPEMCLIKMIHIGMNDQSEDVTVLGDIGVLKSSQALTGFHAQEAFLWSWPFLTSSWKEVLLSSPTPASFLV